MIALLLPLLLAGDFVIDGVLPPEKQATRPADRNDLDNALRQAALDLRAHVASLEAGGGSGDMLKSVYDTNNDGKVDWSANSINATNANAAVSANYASYAGSLNYKLPTDDAVFVGNGSSWQTTTLPSCSGGTKALQYDVAANTFSCATLATPVSWGIVYRIPSGSSIYTTSDSVLSTIFTLNFNVAGHDPNYRFRCFLYTSGNAVGAPRLSWASAGGPNLYMIETKWPAGAAGPVYTNPGFNVIMPEWASCTSSCPASYLSVVEGMVITAGAATLTLRLRSSALGVQAAVIDSSVCYVD